jgi:hypothetical protein
MLGMKMDRIRTDIVDIIFVFIFLFGFGFGHRYEYGLSRLQIRIMSIEYDMNQTRRMS